MTLALIHQSFRSRILLRDRRSFTADTVVGADRRRRRLGLRDRVGRVRIVSAPSGNVFRTMGAGSDDCPTVAVGGCADQSGLHPEVIRTKRLILVPMSAALVRSILHRDWSSVKRLLGAEFPPEWRDDGWRWLKPQAERGEHDDRYLAWGTRLAFPTGRGRSQGRGAVLAEVGFHGPPDTDGEAEIGYRVVARYQRQGLAEEAASALLGWATANGVSGVRACVSPANAASIGLLNKLGFTQAGCNQHRILGDQLVFRRSF